MAKVLIVDDERSIRKTLRAFLQDAGHDVETAADVQSAMQLLKSGDFNVVVSDIDMPQVSGLELLRSIRAVSPRMPVILMTATPTDESDAASATSGVTTCLIKPFSKEAFLHAVANAANANAPGSEVLSAPSGCFHQSKGTIGSGDQGVPGDDEQARSLA